MPTLTYACVGGTPAKKSALSARKNTRERKMETNKIFNMDCLEGMKQIETGTIDLIASDPPYQLTSTRVYRQEKDIGDIKGDGTLRANMQQNTAYGSLVKGFMGKTWDVLPSVEILKECLRVLKPGAFAFWLMTPRQDSQMEFLTRLKEAGFIIAFTPIYWTYMSGFPKATNISKAIEKRNGVKPDKIIPATLGMANNPQWHTLKNQYIMPELQTADAKRLDGSYAGFQPKPAIEVIIVTMKPLSEKTYVEQALKNGKGITWLDDCRVPYALDENPQELIGGRAEHTRGEGYGYKELGENALANDKGRFPANLIVSDDMLNDGSVKTSPSGEVNRQPREGQVFTGNSCGFKSENLTDSGFGDTGSNSRYFSLDAWWSKKVKELPQSVQKVFPFLIVPKASTSERNEGLGDEYFLKDNISPEKEAEIKKWLNL